MRYTGPVPVIPNPVTGSRSHAERVPGRILATGESTRLKNLRSLLDAFRLLRAADASVELVLVGGENVGVRLGAGVTALGPLPRDAVRDLLHTASVLVHPSLEESFGMLVAEAMAALCPVIGGAAAGAIPWLLDGGSAGLLVDVSDRVAIAGAISAVINDPVAAGERAKRAQSRAATLFAPHRVASQYHVIYEQLTARAV
jgi:L-malate glycosyltransferase